MYCGVDTGNLASRVEGFGIVYLEAAACGKLTVSGNQGRCPDAVADQPTGIRVDCTDVPAIKRAELQRIADLNA